MITFGDVCIVKKTKAMVLVIKASTTPNGTSYEVIGLRKNYKGKVAWFNADELKLQKNIFKELERRIG